MDILFSLLIMVIVLGLIYWVVTLLPLPAPFRNIALVIVVVICLIWLLAFLFGAAPGFPALHRHS